MDNQLNFSEGNPTTTQNVTGMKEYTDHQQSGNTQGYTDYQQSANTQGYTDYQQSANAQGYADYQQSGNAQGYTDYQQNANSQGYAGYQAGAAANTGYENYQQTGTQAYANGQYYEMPQYYDNQAYGYQQTKKTAVKNSIRKKGSSIANAGVTEKPNCFFILGIIGAILLILAPFMNFASIHLDTKVSKKRYEVKVNVGFNLFELSKASGTTTSLLDEFDIDYKDDVIDEFDDLDDLEDELKEELDYEVNGRVDRSTIKEMIGTAFLIVRGRFVLLITPLLLILSGIGLFFYTMKNNQKMKMICSAVPIVCMVLLMICAKHFFSIMGIGAWTIIVGIVLGMYSAQREN